MITVSTIELFLKSAELLSDGFCAVELSEYEADNDSPAFLSFDAIDSDNDCSVSYDEITDCSDDDVRKITITPDSIAPFPITFNDLVLIANALANAIEVCKNDLNDPSISADTRSKISTSLKKFDQYYSRVHSFLREYSHR